VTQVELSNRLKNKETGDLNQVIMIQCVGSRNEENPNCSRICCQNAVKNALNIKKMNPDSQIFILYRDMRTYGLLEDYYRHLQVGTDLVVLSAGMVAEDTEELASIVKLARTPEGHFMEAHVKLRPVDMATEGIFVCGTAHSPQLLSESISQAHAAASRATTFLAQADLTLSAVKAQVKEELCASCLICVRSCPYSVPRINEDRPKP